MKRCLNCRRTYDELLDECPYCGYKPRTKAVATRRFERAEKPEIISISSSSKKQKSAQSTGKNIYAASSHSGAFYIKSGERLNTRYSVISVMGFGVFGVAYECFDNYSKQHVVVKEYMPSYLVTRSANGRDVEPISEEAEVKFSIGCDAFIDENEKLGSNNVECVPELIECFRQNNTAYAATQLVGGESLSSVLTRKGKLSYETTAGIITSVLQGLRRLNRIGTIHGDICPENIIVVSENKTYLLDYNLSDFNKNLYTQRESGKPRPGYSALELYYKNMEIGPWTDVYAAAAVMYKMLTGIVIPTAVKRSAGDTLVAVSKLGVPISAGAEKAMLKALKVDYEKRTQSPEDFLNGFVGDGFDNITAVKGRKSASSVPSRGYQRSGRDGSGFLKGLLVFLILAIAAVVIWFFISGVFPLPDAVENFLGLSDSSTSSHLSSDTDVHTDSDERDASSSENDTSSRSTDTESSIFGDIVSRVASGIGDKIESGVSSFIDEHFTSSKSTSSEEYYESSTISYEGYEDGGDGYYYGEFGYYDSYGNYYPYDGGGDYTDGGEQGNEGNDDGSGDQGSYEDTSSMSVGDYVDGAAGLVSGLVDDYLNNN